jgi:hypothetical protein
MNAGYIWRFHQLVAAGGAGSTVMGMGLHALAPSIAESSIGIRKLDRAYGRTPGRAILDETRGLVPGTVAESAQGVLSRINPELERVVNTHAVAPVDMAVPRGIVQAGQNSAIAKNAAGSFAQLEPMAKHLSENFATGAPIPQMVKPIDALNLKRGFGDEFIHNWNPETMGGTRRMAARTYRAMADEIHSSVPGSAELDERASSLIPVAKRAESAELNAPLGQRIAGRFKAHTGALAGAVGGGIFGYERGGPAEALKLGTLGLVAPELIGSPSVQMAIARGLNSGASRVLPKVIGGGALQLTRPDDESQTGSDTPPDRLHMRNDPLSREKTDPLKPAVSKTLKKGSSGGI